jgi:hypothetical protein
MKCCEHGSPGAYSSEWPTHKQYTLWVRSVAYPREVLDSEGSDLARKRQTRRQKACHSGLFLSGASLVKTKV